MGSVALWRCAVGGTGFKGSFCVGSCLSLVFCRLIVFLDVICVVVLVRRLVGLRRLVKSLGVILCPRRSGSG